MRILNNYQKQIYKQTDSNWESFFLMISFVLVVCTLPVSLQCYRLAWSVFVFGFFFGVIRKSETGKNNTQNFECIYHGRQKLCQIMPMHGKFRQFSFSISIYFGFGCCQMSSQVVQILHPICIEKCIHNIVVLMLVISNYIQHICENGQWSFYRNCGQWPDAIAN